MQLRVIWETSLGNSFVFSFIFKEKLLLIATLNLMMLEQTLSITLASINPMLENILSLPQTILQKYQLYLRTLKHPFYSKELLRYEHLFLKWWSKDIEEDSLLLFPLVSASNTAYSASVDEPVKVQIFNFFRPFFSLGTFRRWKENCIS